MSFRKSGLQKEVIALYRRALRLVNTKPPSSQPKFRTFIRYTFHSNAHSVSPRDITTIEHLLRKMGRQVEQMESKAVKDCWVGRDMREWEQRPGNGGRRPRGLS